MLTPEQMERRMRGIGCSEVAAIMGTSKWATPLEIYQRKRGEAPIGEDKLAFRFGHFAEKFILDEWARTRHAIDLQTNIATIQSGHLIGHPDAILPFRCVVQAKTARTKHGWGDPGTDEVPVEYFLQVQAEMHLANVPEAHVAVLFGGAEYEEYFVEANGDLQATIVAEVEAFWQRIESGEPPEPITEAEARQRWGRTVEPRAIVADETDLELISKIQMWDRRLEECEEEKSRHIAQLMRRMREAEVLEFGGLPVATWKMTKGRANFDSKSFAAAHPDLYKQFLKTGEPSRRFLIK